MSPVRLDQRLAAQASQIVDAIRQQGGWSPEVVSRLKGLPAQLRTGGLPATLAFLYAKSTGPGPLPAAYETVRAALVEVVSRDLGWAAPPADALALFTALGDPAVTSAGAMARASERTELLAIWLRRLTEALEGPMAGGDDD
ncbi:CRISPR-associated protein Cmr5 family [Actinomadura pelletieri DSM 43383]|uniref:CRISPR type III-B/RAMP module-associated protein Cmr5 n=1 Tax=Actinomadura pelletieri DSM 43383 TaxID=1120940 RepID=A0A495QA91_9ACTN|nr:type III-B CRISPR module-associated protein Cmr5 [Actinomadura pelletieri]RKS68251.1 CRISPR-associated protein Cmr5 family [Actinomadura pelletieri DSM 43383]